MDTSIPLAPDRYSGKKVGKYEVLCRLSTGGMSEIFLAFLKGMAGFQKLVVLKKILPDIKAEEEIVRMFLNEAKITAAFSHPNIAHIYDLDVDDGELYMAMEFIPGATLIDVARACRQAQEPIPVGLTLASVRDTALALHYAHTFTDPAGRERLVIHRDVAEKNIMVTYEGVTKLLDFGIAKAVGRASRTAAGKVKGTSGYMSPEQIRGEELDPRSDVFGLGVVMHECLTGMRLFYAKSPEEGMRVALETQPSPPSRQNPAVPPELDDIVLTALARERDERFSSALAMARAVEKVAGEFIWQPEQSGAFIRKYFSDRRENTRLLLENATADERTGELKLPKHLLLGHGRTTTTAEGRVVRVDPLQAMPVPKKAPSSAQGGMLPPPPRAIHTPTGPLPAVNEEEVDDEDVHGVRTRLRQPKSSQPKRKSEKYAIPDRLSDDEQTVAATNITSSGQEPVFEDHPDVVTDAGVQTNRVNSKDQTQPRFSLTEMSAAWNRRRLQIVVVIAGTAIGVGMLVALALALRLL